MSRKPAHEKAGARRRVDPHLNASVAQLAALIELIEWGAERLSTLRKQFARLATQPEDHAEECEELRYADVVRFLVTNRPAAGQTATGAAAMLHRNTHHLVVDVCFLDRHDEPMIGTRGAPHRTYNAQRLDAELTTAFDDNDVIVFT